MSLLSEKTPNKNDAIRDECMLLPGYFRGYCPLSLRPCRGDIENSDTLRYWSSRAEVCASGILDDPGLLEYFAVRCSHTP